MAWCAIRAACYQSLTRQPATFTAITRVQIPSGTPYKIKSLEIRSNVDHFKGFNSPDPRFILRARSFPHRSDTVFRLRGALQTVSSFRYTCLVDLKLARPTGSWRFWMSSPSALIRVSKLCRSVRVNDWLTPFTLHMSVAAEL